MHRAFGVCLCLAFTALPASLAVSAGAPTAAVHVDFSEVTLKNGLRVQLVEDHGTPVIAVNVAYDVGSRNERPGLTGFAHLFEHMMFKGSKNVGDGEHFYQVLTNGGAMNGTTSADLTLYFESLPANQLELALFLEADRMRSLEITQENLDNQREAVQEERRLRVDNQPYGRADEHFDELFYSNFAYQHSTIGSMEDLNAASVADVAQFFKTYYAPNNAVLSLVGDFRSAEALALIVELRLRDLERAHAVRFQEQRELELIRRQRLEVQRQVAAGGAVHRAAVGEHLVEVLAVADVVRSLEHHVLEQVGEAGAPGSFVARADVVSDVQCDDRCAVVLDELYTQAVGERGVGEFDADRSRMGFAFRGTGDANCREQGAGTEADSAIHGVSRAANERPRIHRGSRGG